jgi:hypothetical protein
MAYLNANMLLTECSARSHFLQNKKEFNESKGTHLPVFIFRVASLSHCIHLFHFIVEDERV